MNRTTLNRVMRGALTAALGGLLIVGGAGMPAQADEATASDTTLSITLDHAKVHRGTSVVATVIVETATNPDGGTMRVDVNDRSRSSVVAGSRASITLPIGTHNVVAHLRAEGQSEGVATARTVVTVVSAARVTLGMNAGGNALFADGEQFWLRAQVRSAANRPLARQKVTLYSYVGSHRLLLARLTSDVNGRISLAVRTAATTQFKATSGSLASPMIRATRTAAARTLEQRAVELGSIIGAPTAGKVVTGATTYRRYTRGMLVQTRLRTWLVRGEILKEYARRNVVTGGLGVPTSDERCGLKEGACLQRFQRTGIADAWCGYFVSWVSVASGHGSAVVKSKSCDGMLSAERKRGRMTHTPGIGRLTYLGYFQTGVASHVGIVVKFTAEDVWTVEGNVSAGGGMNHPRGVHKVKRHRTKVVCYAKPRW